MKLALLRSCAERARPSARVGRDLDGLGVEPELRPRRGRGLLVDLEVARQLLLGDREVGHLAAELLDGDLAGSALGRRRDGLEVGVARHRQAPFGRFQCAVAGRGAGQRRQEAAGDVGPVEQVELGHRRPGRRARPSRASRSARARCAAPRPRRPTWWRSPRGRPRSDRRRRGSPARVGGAAVGPLGAGQRLLLAHPRPPLEGAAHQLEVGAAVGRHRQPPLVRGGRQVQPDPALGMPLAPAGVRGRARARRARPRSSAARPDRPTRACRRTPAPRGRRPGRAARRAARRARRRPRTRRRCAAGSRSRASAIRTPARTSSCSGPPWRAPCSAAQPMSRQSARPTPWARCLDGAVELRPGPAGAGHRLGEDPVEHGARLLDVVDAPEHGERVPARPAAPAASSARSARRPRFSPSRPPAKVRSTPR